MRAWTILGLLAVIGCSDSTTEATDQPEPGPVELSAECEAKIGECLINQQTCVEADGKPQCTACPPNQYAHPDTGLCEDIGGKQMVNEFPDNTTEPGEEILGVCRSWTLGNEKAIWVNAVELQQNEASHHSNWLFAPEDQFDGPDGFWKCRDRGYSQLKAALLGGVLYAQSTQAEREVQKFPDGVAVRIPPRSRIISDVHVLNTTKDEVTGNAKLTLYTIEEENVTVKLAPFHLTYDGLDIPPQATSRFTGECDLRAAFEDNKQPAVVNGDIYYILPHTHALGSRFFTDIMGGPDDGQRLIDISGFNSEARGRSYNPPVKVRDATGFRFGCEFDNPRTERVGWGFGDQEMCELLGFWASPLAFESRVEQAVDQGKDGSVHLYDGDGECSTIAFPFAQDK